MNTLLRTAAFVTALGALAVACAKVPITGRTQYNVVPDGIMKSLGRTSYSDMLSSVRVERRSGDAQLLQKVGGRISQVARRPDFDWAFSLIDDDTINAWCLPGGYIGFYTGILPVLRNEAGMAFVMGHEVGHATARHGAERMTQQLTLIGGLAGLELYMANKTKLDPKQRAVILAALGVGAYGGVLLPYSRMHESEADVIGMMYMAGAGYPPAESIKVWERMEEIAGKSNVPSFLSTHPSHAKRQDNLREWLPRARKRFERNQLGHDTLKALWSGGKDSGRDRGTDRNRSQPRRTTDR